jgi:hypothetical protein
VLVVVDAVAVDGPGLAALPAPPPGRLAVVAAGSVVATGVPGAAAFAPAVPTPLLAEPPSVLSDPHAVTSRTAVSTLDFVRLSGVPSADHILWIRIMSLFDFLL